MRLDLILMANPGSGNIGWLLQGYRALSESEFSMTLYFKFHSATLACWSLPLLTPVILTRQELPEMLTPLFSSLSSITLFLTKTVSVRKSTPAPKHLELHDPMQQPLATCS